MALKQLESLTETKRTKKRVWPKKKRLSSAQQAAVKTLFDGLENAIALQRLGVSAEREDLSSAELRAIVDALEAANGYADSILRRMDYVHELMQDSILEVRSARTIIELSNTTALAGSPT